MQQLGYLEETILLLIMAMKEREAYGFSVAEEYKNHTGKSLSISAVHTVLSRLEKKGYINSEMKGATEARGGRRKRIFVATSAGQEILIQLKENRQKLWTLIPKLS